ncbi:MAG: plasmid maintenance system killer protein [Deltaproteobacteria bacterium]|nr:plasmid maintenance system killer protein [Deltaproteobacteria bacterium]
MHYGFKDKELDQLDTDPKFNGGYSEAIVRGFRRRMQQIRSAFDERDFYAQKSLHFEKLKGDRSHQHSMKINKQWRLILELHGEGSSKMVLIVGIEDYH